jgi:glyoxylase I family protein
MTDSFKFHHLALSVLDLGRSIKFYRHLGFAEVHRYEAPDGSLRIVHLALRGAILELFCFTESEQASRSTTTGNDLSVTGIKHFGLQVESIQEVFESLSRLGLVDESKISLGRTGIEYFFIQDPDGVWVEMVQDDRVFSD